ncbi:MAG: hypothetical protein M1818_003287 [Claussenomyces sp. TS43310]|nr:MAG: hypothetical protein M1818_003287 [Claussenomyces sp. TS43310]
MSYDCFLQGIKGSPAEWIECHGTTPSSSPRLASCNQGLPSLDEASMSVDALVADSDADVPGSPMPNEFGTVSRSSTPSIPPGFGLPHGHPPPALREDPPTKPLSRIVPTSAPFTPLRNITSNVPRAATPLANVSVPGTPVQRVATPLAGVSSTLQAKQDLKSLATNTGLSKTIASQAAQGVPLPNLQSEDFPVLQKGKGKESSLPAMPKSLLSTSHKTASARSGSDATTPMDPTEKRPSHSAPKIAPTLQILTKQVSTSDTTSKTPASAAFPPLPPSMPASATTPATRNTPKTLRVVPTPKAETPSGSASTPISSASFAVPPLLPSRQPSLASISRLDRPNTPVSEIISDNASITSASMSRPGSPPQSKVGSAPVRTTTKSQQKKQRKEAQKEKGKSDLDTLTDKPEPEVEIAPIMGRKKKQKKDKGSSSARKAPAAANRQQSPISENVGAATKQAKAAIAEQKASAQSKTPEEVVPKVERKGQGNAKGEESLVAETPAPTVETVNETPEKTVPNPTAVLQELVSSGALPDPNGLVMFKAPISSNQRLDVPGALQNLEHKLVITEEDRATLQAGRPVRKIAQGSSRILLTPNGDCVRNLSPAEEERYLELQSRILSESGPTAFVSARHNTSNGFTLIGGRAVPNGPPTFFPQSDNSGAIAHIDAVSKIQRDEALSYINQYVLPSLSTNSQLERALNANALDAEMLRPNETQTWGAWGASVGTNASIDLVAVQNEHNASLQRAYGSSSSDGILATGLESMTAHFAVGRENGRGQPLGNVSLLGVTESEGALQNAKKETEKLEKSLNQLLKKNRRLLLGAGH